MHLSLYLSIYVSIYLLTFYQSIKLFHIIDKNPFFIFTSHWVQFQKIFIYIYTIFFITYSISHIYYCFCYTYMNQVPHWPLFTRTVNVLIIYHPWIKNISVNSEFRNMLISLKNCSTVYFFIYLFFFFSFFFSLFSLFLLVIFVRTNFLWSFYLFIYYYFFIK